MIDIATLPTTLRWAEAATPPEPGFTCLLKVAGGVVGYAGAHDNYLVGYLLDGRWCRGPLAQPIYQRIAAWAYLERKPDAGP
jgi:hypothetical protein